MASKRSLIFIATMLCCQGCNAKEELPNRRAAFRAQSVFAAVGMEYEIKSDEGKKVPAAPFLTTIFKNHDSLQILFGVSANQKLPSFAPLNAENISDVGPTLGTNSGIYLATLTPKPEYATYEFKTPLVGKYTYFKSHDSTDFFQTVYTPILVDLSKFQSSHHAQSELNLIFDDDTNWIPFPQISSRTFAVVLRSAQLKTKQGKAVPFRTLLLFSFQSDDSGIPSEAWISGEWVVAGIPCLIHPKAASATHWTFANWNRHSSGIEYPFHQIEEQYSSDTSMQDMLDESTGCLENLAKGNLESRSILVSRREINIKKWEPIPTTENLFLKPIDGVAVRDSDTNELYVAGVDKAESNRLLGIKEPVNLPPPRRPYGKYLVFAAGVILSVVGAIWILRRRT